MNRSDDLKGKIARLLTRYLHELTMPPGDVLEVCEDLRVRTEELDTVWDAVQQLTHRVAQLEKTAPTYKDPHHG